MRLIDTSHLETWANGKSSQSDLPEILKSLIIAVIEPKLLKFPSGDAVWLPGFDGEVINAQTNRFVPTGKSVWEVGTDRDFRSKANSDYEKRSGVLRRDVTFVFVTPRLWKDKDKWVEGRKIENKWSDVRVIDGAELVDWLDTAEAVQLEFAGYLRLIPKSGLRSANLAWEEWACLSDPRATEDMVTIGRQEQESSLVKLLIGPPCCITVRAHSPREAWGFVLAVLRRVTSQEDRQRFAARTLIASDQEVAGQLHHLRNLIVILKQATSQVSGTLLTAGCHVIISEGTNGCTTRNVIELPRPTHQQFADTIERIGKSRDDASRIARESGQSVTVFQRLYHAASVPLPSWAQGNEVRSLLPAVLAGRWGDRCDDDRSVLCSLAGIDVIQYPELISKLQFFRSKDEAPLYKFGDMWTLTAPVDAFQSTARFLTSDDLNRFAGAFRHVFGRIDTKVDIPLDEWLYEDIKGQQGHSGWLRTGMAETLLLIAERGENARLDCNGVSARAFAECAVRGLPGLNDDWRVLASIRDQLPRLMEAAPGPLLDALEHMLEGDPSDLAKLFAEGKSLFSSGSMHTELLWGLELLAWSPNMFHRVCLVLAHLAAIDPGGKTSNRPINSLCEILLWWNPGTCASTDQRLLAIDAILRFHSEVGWTLLEGLLPKGHGATSFPTAKPRWRALDDVPEESRSRTGQRKYLSGIMDRALSHVGASNKRWSSVLHSLYAFGPTQVKRVIALLSSVSKQVTESESKRDLWQTIHDFVNHHKAYADANWALSNDVLDSLESTLPNLLPDDPVQRHLWLFDDWFPDALMRIEETDHGEERLGLLRQEAVREVMEAGGTSSLIDLGTRCKFPGFVAAAVVRNLSNTAEVLAIIEEVVIVGESALVFAANLSAQAERVFGETWRQIVLGRIESECWSAVISATLMVFWSDDLNNWKRIETLSDEIKDYFWKTKPVYGIGGSTDVAVYQTNGLIGAGRANVAFDRIAHKPDQIPTETLLRVFDTTFDQINQAQTVEQIQELRVHSYEINRLLDALRKRENVPRWDIVSREYRALPLMGSVEVRGLTIHEYMADDPKFFVEILCDAFLPHHRNKDDDGEATDEQRARGRAAYTLLKGMDKIPGRHSDSEIDGEILAKWIDSVRVKAKSVDRAEVADLAIGELLAHAPDSAEDGAWPHWVIRDQIDRLQVRDIDRGIALERFNMRGVTTKSLYEGGAQERELASKYREWAEKSRSRWPRMAQVLTDIAESWDHYADVEDIRAQQDKFE